ncbi:MAG: DUF3857 domain-containing transglutaminase family protein [Limisphaerales bacterium]
MSHAAESSKAMLPPEATVVLLEGLPGDLESETAYRGVLEGWLELLRAGGHTGKVFVLCDNPGSVALPPGGRMQVLPGTRAAFLGLGSMVEGRSNSLVVIAWGHGGRQGDTPVFHVRGPRLTPADMTGLAAGTPASDSTWVLFFRGSGAFARQLAGEHRRLLSSECDTPFQSDPVGMTLVLKLARANPGLSLSSLGEAIGSATRDWYEERHLARTEEPTLWLAREEPRPLAAGAKLPPEGGVPQAGKGEPRRLAGSAEPARAGPAPESVTTGADLPAVWKEIKRVQPGNYPDADGVTLRRRLICTLGTSPALSSDREDFVQVLTPEGKRLGDFDISYSPPYEEVNFVDCEVLRPDGKLVRLDAESVHEAGEEPLGDYQAGRRKVFSLPGVGPGAIVHVRYRTEWKEFPLPRVSLELPIDLELPMVEGTVEVRVPNGMPFHFALEHLAAAEPAVEQGGYGASYVWRLADLPARSREVLAPPNQQPCLLLSTFVDWRAFADWYSRISQMSDVVTPEIQAKAAELTREARVPREKVLALYNYVTGLRYVAVPLGVNSFRPHAAANVLRNQYGDCKDKANLLNTLLRTLNIEAHLVLVPRFSQAHEAIPGLAFNHAISRVSLDGEALWLDTTDDICRFGLLPPGDPGRKVLVIDGHPTGLVQLPPPAPSRQRLELRGQLDGAGPADALPLKLEAVAMGYPDYELREAARQAKELATLLPLLTASFRPVAGTFAMASQSASPVSALDENFRWRAEGAQVGILSSAGRRRQLRAPFWLPKEWDLALQERKTALFLNQGYPLTLEEVFTIRLPSNPQALALPAVCENDEEPLRWKVQWDKSGENQVAAHLRVELARGELEPGETALVQKQLRGLLAALAADAEF